MSTSVHKYLDYIDQQVQIAPANSQEELQAAQMIEGVFRAHDLDPEIQEFSAPATASFVRGIIQALLLLSILVAGIGIGFLSPVFALLGIAAAVILTMDAMGQDLLSRWTPAARSQNVVAVHRATGDLVSKGNRPIVVVAHYDTPRESILAVPSIARLLSTIRHLAFFCAPVCGLICLIEAFAAGTAFGRVLWLLGILAAIPVAVLGVAAIAERFAPCSLGANDNKASLAALFDILNTVRPVEDDLNGFVASPVREEPATSPTAEPIPVYEEVVGVRHGKEVVEALGMLPDDCEIEYLEPKLIRVEYPETAPAQDPVGVDVVKAGDASGAEQGRADADADAPAVTSELSPDGSEMSPEADATSRMDTVVAEGDPAPQSGDGDSSGLEAMGSSDPNATIPSVRVDAVADPAVPSDPNWGKTNFRPAQAPVARRASLFDLPDPAAAEPDPLALSDDPGSLAPGISVQQPVGGSDGQAASDGDQGEQQFAFRGIKLPSFRSGSTGQDDVTSGQDGASSDATTQPVDGATVMMPASPAPDGRDAAQQLSSNPLQEASSRANAFRPKKGRLAGLFGRKKKQESMGEWLGVGDDYDARADGNNIGSWDNFDSHDSWKGGAAVGVQFRVIDGGGDGDVEDAREVVDGTPTEEEMREAILGMGDDRLVCHDIWFVALGASELDHAGMDAFLDDFRSSVRGSFVINLDSVGAGTLTLLGQEGVFNKRRADRRLSRLLLTTAEDLHISLGCDRRSNSTTDATVAMRRSMRSVTVTGLNECGVPAFSRTQQDVPENIDERQVSDVANLVCEAIRRS